MNTYLQLKNVQFIMSALRLKKSNTNVTVIYSVKLFVIQFYFTIFFFFVIFIVAEFRFKAIKLFIYQFKRTKTSYFNVIYYLKNLNILDDVY